MSKIKNPKFIQFSSLIHSGEASAFHSSPESISRFDSGLEEILKEAEKAKAHSWVSKANAELAAFTEKVKEKISAVGISRSQILEMLRAKKMTGYQHQFRNKKLDEMTDDELLSVLEDHEILELLNKKKRDSNESG